MFVCVGFNLSFGLLASRARSRFSEGTDLCGSGGSRVPAVRFMELDLLVAGDNDSAEKSTISAPSDLRVPTPVACCVRCVRKPLVDTRVF